MSCIDQLSHDGASNPGRVVRGAASLLTVGWVSIASLATAAGTLIFAVATFAAVRSANRAARAAERSLLVGLRPLIMPSRLQDPPQKVMFGDRKWFTVPGGCAVGAVEDGIIYLTASLRNVGPGIGVLHGWRFYPETYRGPAPQLSQFRRLNRDIYLPPGDVGFWQGAFRDPADPSTGRRGMPSTPTPRSPWRSSTATTRVASA